MNGKRSRCAVEEGPFIRSLQMVNFMCHRNLLVEFTGKVCCITGENGSGKSAVMVALGVLFGVRAYAMERGSRMRDLIKTGEEASVVKATLRNADYNIEGAGPLIGIQRTILSEGSSRLKITGEDGRVIGTTQEDLATLMDHFRLNLNNPLCFLTQDHSKKLLRIAAPAAIYKFFKMGTDVEEMEAMHAQAMASVGEMERSLEAVDGMNEEVAGKLKKIDGILKYLESAEGMSSRLEDLQKELYWARVADAEKKKRDSEVKLEELYKEFGAISEKTQKHNEEYVLLTEEIRRKSQERQERAHRKREREQEREGAIEKELRRKRGIERELEFFEESVSQREETVRRLEKILSQSTAQETADPREILSDLQREIEACDSKEMELEKRKKDACEDQAKFCAKKEQYRWEKEKLEGKIRRYAEVIASQEAFDPLKFFSPKMQQAIRMIKERGIKAIGPIGLEIGIKDPQWSRAIEAVLGNTVHGFIVTNRRARGDLLDLFRSLGVQYPVYFSREAQGPRPALLSKLPPAPRGARTVLSQITGPSAVIEQLVILVEIERAILVEQRAAAHQLLRDFPGTLDVAYTKEADKIRCMHGKLSDMRCRLPERSLFAVPKERTASLVSQKEELKRELVRLEEEVSKEGTDLAERAKAMADEQLSLQKKKRHLEAERKRVRETLCDDVADELRKSQRDLEVSKSQVSSMRATLKEIEATIASQAASSANKDTAAADHTEAESEEMRKRQRGLQLEIGRAEIDAKRTQALIDELARKVEEMSREYSESRHSALSTCNGEIRITAMAPIQIEAEINLLTTKLAVLREEAGNVEGILDSRDRLGTRKKRLDQITAGNRSRIAEMKASMEKRVARREALRHKLASKCAARFARCLEMRGYEGSLKFDHEKEELGIELKTEGGSGNKNSLSGGERSFASTCFLLSLWPCISSPIRILDEFDVYMDEINRKAALHLVLDAALDAGSQVILITPLSVADAPRDKCQVITLKRS